MKVLIVGSGGREHAIAWALRRSPHLALLRCAPGNAGIAREADCVDLSPGDIDGLAAHVNEAGYDLVVVGPEAPLVAGLGDRLREAGISVFGPSAAAAELEGSKIFTKLFMQRHDIPTAGFQVFGDSSEARRYLSSPDTAYPVVVKADGLAAGKGVIIAESREAAVAAAKGMLSGGSFGDAGRRIVVEECLHGREASFFVLSDGRLFAELATCQDYKRAEDDDRGPNTGGMGAYSPSVYLDERTREQVLRTIVRPTVEGLGSEGRPYQGVLYIGLMLTEEGPRVLEYNARFGDPETQVLMSRLDGDWLELFRACADGTLSGTELTWKPGAAVCIVMASGGYPGAYAKGCPIEGVADGEADGAVVFHAGTRLDHEGRLVTAGGRVLGVTALGPDLAMARRRAYSAVDKIHWEDEHHRGDIARDALKRSRV